MKRKVKPAMKYIDPGDEIDIDLPQPNSDIQERIRELLYSSNTNLSTATGKESFISQILSLLESELIEARKQAVKEYIESINRATDQYWEYKYRKLKTYKTYADVLGKKKKNDKWTVLLRYPVLTTQKSKVKSDDEKK